MTTENTEDTELKACIKKHAKEILSGFSSEELWYRYAEALEKLCQKLERERDEARTEVEKLRESFRCLLNPQCAVEEAAK